VSYRLIISSRFYVRLKGTSSQASRELLSTGEQTKQRNNGIASPKYFGGQMFDLGE